MSNSIVRKAIEVRLNMWAQSQSPPIPIVLENTKYAPIVGQRYLRGFLMPGEPRNLTQGGQHKQYQGMYQISAYFPEELGVGDIEDAAKAIEVLFAAPTTIVREGHQVNITRTPAVARGAPDGAGFFMVPITIWYEMQDFT